VAKRLASSGGGDGGNAKSNGNVSPSTNVHVDDDNKDGEQDEDVDVDFPNQIQRQHHQTQQNEKRFLLYPFYRVVNIDVNGPRRNHLMWYWGHQGFRLHATRSTQNVRVPFDMWWLMKTTLAAFMQREHQEAFTQLLSQL
jgi:hypothetical protein